MKSVLTASVNELLKPWPITATNVISARPIMTAAAVDAVRAGVPDRVLAGQLAGRAAEAGSRRSQHVRQRPDDPGRDHRDADEHQQHADDEQDHPGLDLHPACEDAVGEERDRRSADDRGRRHRVAGEPRRRHDRALANRRDRLDARGAHGRPQARQERDQRARRRG